MVSLSDPVLALRLVASACLVSILAVWQGEQLIAQLLDPISKLINLIDTNHVVLGLSIDRVGADTVLHMKAGIRRLILTGSNVTFADPRAIAVVTTPLAAFLIAPSVMLTLVLAWPVRQPQDWLIRLALVLPIAAVLFAADAPFALDGYLWEMHRDAHTPDSTSPILVWKSFLVQGGRFVLGGFAAVLCLTAYAPLSRIHPQPARNATLRR